MYNIKQTKSNSSTRLNFGIPGIPPTIFKVTHDKGKDGQEDKMKIEGGRFGNGKRPQIDMKYNKVDKPTTMKKDNSKPYNRNKNKYEVLGKQEVNSGPKRMYGIDDRKSTSVGIKSTPNQTLFVNPFSKGGYTPTTAQNTQNTNLALNLSKFNPTGFADTKAYQNFSNNIFSNIIAKIAQQSNASAFQTITLNNLVTYFFNVSQLIDYFYEMDAILAWSPNVNENNEAMTSVKYLFDTPNLLTTKYDLRSFLNSCVAPTELIDFLIWKNQNYRTSPLANSTVMRFSTYALAEALKTNDTAGYINSINICKSNISAAADATNILSTKTRATISGVLFRFVDGYNEISLPLICNNSTYDPDFSDLFRNQSVIYDVTGSSIYPTIATPNDGTRYFTTTQDPSQIKNSTLALSGKIGGNLNDTGLFYEGGYPVSTTENTNKLVYSFDSNKFSLFSRIAYDWDITGDTHVVSRLSTTSVSKVSKVPVDSQLVYYQGTNNLDVALREFQNNIFML